MSDTLQARISHALSHIRNPRTGQDVLTAEKVRDIATTTTGKVRLSLMMARGDDPALAGAIRETVERVEGVTDVQVNIVDADLAAQKRASRTLPVMEAPPAAGRAAPAGRHAPQQPVAFP